MYYQKMIAYLVVAFLIGGCALLLAFKFGQRINDQHIDHLLVSLIKLRSAWTTNSDPQRMLDLATDANADFQLARSSMSASTVRDVQVALDTANDAAASWRFAVSHREECPWSCRNELNPLLIRLKLIKNRSDYDSYFEGLGYWPVINGTEGISIAERGFDHGIDVFIGDLLLRKNGPLDKAITDLQ